MELRDYLLLARRNLTWLIAVPLLFAAAAYANAARAPKMYSSTATVLLRPNDPTEKFGSASGAGATEIINADRLVKALANIARGPEVRAEATKWLTDATEGEIQSALTVAAAADSNILRISGRTRVPERSAAIANAVVDAYIENRRQASVGNLEVAIETLDESIKPLDERIAELYDESESDARADELSALNAQRRDLSAQRSALVIDSQLKRGEAEKVAEAVPSFTPISPKPLRSSILGLLVGLMAVAGLVLLKDRLDLRLRSRSEAEEITGAATLAEIPLDRNAFRESGHIEALENPNGVVAESIRSLRVSLRFLGLDDPLRVILVTSALPGDGKSTVSANLAGSYALSGARTLLVSADLRRPQVERITDAPTESGLVDILNEMAGEQERRQRRSRTASRRNQAVDGYPEPPSRRRGGAAVDNDLTSELAARKVDILNYCHLDADNLWVLPAGQPVANPVEILGSPVAKDFFAAARDEFDIVIVDSPPVVPVSDSLVMSQLVDGVVFVTSLRHTNRNSVSRATELLESVNARVLGITLNRVPRDGDGYGYGYYGYYGNAEEKPKRLALRRG